MRETNGAKSNLNKMVQYEALAGQGREGKGEKPGGVWPTGPKQRDQGSGALCELIYRYDGSGGLGAWKAGSECKIVDFKPAKQ